MVQLLEAPALIVAGLQLRAETVGSGFTVTAAVRLTPEALAVTTTLVEAATPAAVALKLVLLALCATVTEAGTGSAALLLLSATANPPDSAALVSDTVQVTTCAGYTGEGLQARPESAGSARMLRVAV
jgi:hypothetical protein